MVSKTKQQHYQSPVITKALFGKDDDDSAIFEEKYKEEYERVRDLLPHGDVSPLFESEDCLLCKGDHPGKRSFYAITDMGHKEPQGKKTSAIGIRVKTKIGSMVPLQIACCPNCRKIHLVASYMKIATIIAIMTISLIALALPPVTNALQSIHEGVPLIIFIVMLPVGWLIATAFTNRYIRKHSGSTRFNIAEIPFIHEMMEAGWFPLYETGKISRLVFSKERLKQGWFI